MLHLVQVALRYHFKYTVFLDNLLSFFQWTGPMAAGSSITLQLHLAQHLTLWRYLIFADCQKIQTFIFMWFICLKRESRRISPVLARREGTLQLGGSGDYNTGLTERMGKGLL